MSAESPFLLVDGNNLLMRAFFATQRSGMAADGIPTGPLLVFVNTLSRHIREEKPAYVAVAWDGGRSTERTALSPEYKANRAASPVEETVEGLVEALQEASFTEAKTSSFALAKEFLSLANVYQGVLPGYEADDLIAAWWRGTIDPRPPVSTQPVRILSSDKDFLQLVGRTPMGAHTELIRLSSSDTPTDRWTHDRVVEELGYQPANWPLITALTGDKSDNVIGVPGIGPKRALKLLEDWKWDLEAVLGTPKVREHAEQVRTNLKLVDLRNGDLVLPRPPRFRPTTPDDALHEPLTSFLDRYRLSSVSGRYLSGTLWSGASTAVMGRALGSR